MVKEKLGPALKREFPNRQQITILLDGEKVFRAPEAKRARKGLRLESLTSVELGRRKGSRGVDEEADEDGKVKVQGKKKTARKRRGTRSQSPCQKRSRNSRQERRGARRHAEAAEREQPERVRPAARGEERGDGGRHDDDVIRRIRQRIARFSGYPVELLEPKAVVLDADGEVRHGEESKGGGEEGREHLSRGRRSGRRKAPCAVLFPFSLAMK